MRTWNTSAMAMAAVLMLEPATARAQASDRITVPLSNPAGPATVTCGLISGSIAVTAYEGKEVIIEPRLVKGDEDDQARWEEMEERRREREERRRERERERAERRGPKDHEHDRDEDEDVDRAAGLRRIGNLSAGLSIEEHDNEVTIGGPMRDRRVDLDIKVPASAALHLSTVNDGDIVVRNVRGEIEAQNTNGRVTLTRVAGPVVAHALNGDVVVEMAGAPPDRPTQLSSMNGDIDLTLPTNVKATLWIRADNGEIYTDFDLDLKSRAMPDGEGGSKRGKAKKEYGYQTGMHGTLNGGGAEIRLVTYNGNVYIRKAK